LPGFIHGDLQFDNVIINNEGKFKVIDWRHEFANIVEFGDIYYDLAKLAGGFIINYANIKEHNFNIEIDNDNVTLSIPSIDQVNVYQQQLKEFVISQGYDYKKVEMLIPIIYWNMSPLHTAPFDLFLWYLSIKLFQELE
jgi:thiamine kinase-like enzyme